MEALKEDLLESKRELVLQTYLKNLAEQKAEELNRQIEILHAEVSALKQRLSNQDTQDATTQTGVTPTVVHSHQGVIPSFEASRSGFDPTSEDSLVAPDLLENGIGSLADTLRQTAEEAVVQSGYVLDEASGMYYDYNTGYYYDPNTCLLYDPHSGTYYTYNEESGGYQFHSKVDLSSYTAASQKSTQDDQRLTWETKKKAKKKAKKKTSAKKDSKENKVGKEEKLVGRSNKRLNDGASLSAAKSEERSKHKRRKQKVTDEEHRHAKSSAVSTGSERRHKKLSVHKKRKRAGHREKHGSVGELNESKLLDKDGIIMISDDELSLLPEEIDGNNLDGIENVSDEGEEMELRDDDVTCGYGDHRARGSHGERKNIGEPQKLPLRTAGRSSSESVGKTVRSAERRGDSELAIDGARDVSEGEDLNSESEERSGTTAVGEISHTVDSINNGAIVHGDNENKDVSMSRMDENLKTGVMKKMDRRSEGYLDSPGSEMEEGELSDWSEDSNEDISGDSSSSGQEVTSSGSSTGSSDEESDSSGEEERVESPVNPMDYPPCVRLIVTESEFLQLGSLHVVTVLGGTIGREGTGHILKIPEIMVSKLHAEITYNTETKCYSVKDLGSQNGTLLNGNAIAMGRVQSESQVLSHRDTLQFGATVLEAHIHQGNWTCPGCEPGLVQAKLAAETNQSAPPAAPTSRRDKEALRRKELKKIKKKYSLLGEEYKVNDPTMRGKYADRAAERRQVVGSDNPHQRDDAPSSVDRAIDSSNKGHQMLLKMGWKEGDPLGAGDSGIREPIQVGLHSTKAGLGSCSVMPMDTALNRSKKVSISWSKSRERLAQRNPLYPDAGVIASKFIPWVEGGSEVLPELEGYDGENKDRGSGKSLPEKIGERTDINDDPEHLTGSVNKTEAGGGDEPTRSTGSESLETGSVGNERREPTEKIDMFE